MRRTGVMVIAVIGLLAIFAVGGALAQEEGPETPEVNKQTNTGTVFRGLDNPCTDTVESIDFSGTFTTLTQTTAEGKVRITHIQTEDVVGRDRVSGEQYRLEEVRNISRNPPIAPRGESPTDRTDSFTFRVYSLEGNAPLFVVHTTARLTTTPDGERVVDFRDTYAQCPGQGRVN